MAYRVLWTMALVGLLTGCRAIAPYPYAEAGHAAVADAAVADAAVADAAVADAAVADAAVPDATVLDATLPDAQVDDAPADVPPPLPDGPPLDVTLPDVTLPDVALPVDSAGVLQVPLPLAHNCTAGSGHWCWANPWPQGNALHDVFCLSSGTRKGECFAVGDGGTLLHRPAGKDWKLLESGTDKDLSAIWVDADTHRIVVAGREGLIRVSKNQGAGVAWVPNQITATGRHPNFVALWGEPSGAIYVGADGSRSSPPGIWRWTQGSSASDWVPIESGVEVRAFWGDGKGRVYAATSDGVKMVDSQTTLGHAGSYACAQTSLRDLVGVGSGTSQELLVLGVDDSVYEVSAAQHCAPLVILPTGTGHPAQGIWGLSKSDFYVLGEDPTGRKGYIDHYNGPTKLTAGTLFPMTAIASAGPSAALVAVGKVGEIWEKPAGKPWDSKVTRLAEGRTLGSLAEADALYAGGDGGTLLKFDSGMTWKKWTPSSSFILGPIRGLSGQKAVSGGTPAELWAVDSGTALRELLPAPSVTIPSGLKKLSAVQDFVKVNDHRIIVGGYASLAMYFPDKLHWETVSATTMPILAGQTVTSLWSPDGQNLYFVTRPSTLSTYKLYYGSLTNPSPTQEQPFASLADPVYRVVGIGPTVYALGRGQLASKSSTGNPWIAATMPSDLRLRAIWGLAQESSTGALWAVGEHGVVLFQSSGSSWSLGESRCRQTLRDVAIYGASGSRKVWAVGDKGAIIYRALP